MTENIAKPWSGVKEFKIEKIVSENPEVKSFYLVPCDGSKVIAHKAGQFLPIRINSDDKEYDGLIRTYSLSLKPNNDYYRLSIKRIEGGKVSSYMHDKAKVGDTIGVRMPFGNFVLKDKPKEVPLVLLSGGIGITPVLSMLHEAVGKRNKIYFVECNQNSRLQALSGEIEEYAKKGLVTHKVFFDSPLESDVIGKDYDVKGYISEEWIKDNLPLNGEFYFCGPPIFMKLLNKYLKDLGVPKENRNYEFFGKPQDIEL
ncbi:MAG: FAD-binding oxidoreductase [Clostridium sp.]|uniref:FAD-binding oxidoreductase n=1 Tax=Clostridium sp. TaxID=1506 RepID=UPI002FCA6FFD